MRGLQNSFWLAGHPQTGLWRARARLTMLAVNLKLAKSEGLVTSLVTFFRYARVLAVGLAAYENPTCYHSVLDQRLGCAE
jgi:hypothetical protein